MDSRILNFGKEKRYIPRGLLLQWHVTERCNLSCAHCYQESADRGELGFRSLLEILNQFKELLDGWRSATAPRPIRAHVTVTGGEPFLRGDFVDLLEVLAANRDRFSFAILTNGYYIDRSVARHLRKLRPAFVQVSIEGSRKTHDKLRGAGSFERTASAIESMVREGIRTLISFTAHRGNYREFPEVARYGTRLRVARVWADRVIPRGSGLQFLEQMLTPEETLEFFEIMHNARTVAKRSWFAPTEIAMHRALQFLVAGGTPYHCTAGDTLVAVQPNGDVYPCRRMPIRVGNLLETPLAELYYESPVLRTLRDRSIFSDPCEGCCYVKLCRGGLKCLSYAVSRDPFQADPGCRLARRRQSAIPLENCGEGNVEIGGSVASHVVKLIDQSSRCGTLQ